MSSATSRRVTVAVAIVLAVAIPGLLSDYYRSLAALSAITALIVLSLNLLTGFVGQISFCQYSFAAFGALTVGSLTGGHHWSFWAALPLGVLFAALVGLLVGIPALRLSGLFIAILTVGFALFCDRFFLASGGWDAFSGGINPWQVARPSLFGLHLTGQYSFYLFSLVILLLVTLLVWNLRIGKTGRVLRAIRESEVAASTMGLDLTKWKLATFAVSAGIAGLAGGLLAAEIGSVSPASYDFLHSIPVVAIVVVMGVGSIASAAAGGIFLLWGPELLRHTGLNVAYFSLILGVLLILQIVFSPQGAIVRMQQDLKKLLGLTRRGKDAELVEVL
jgi:branched-chain amino acid transport system permease protein